MNMSLGNNLLYTRIYYRLWDKPDYGFSAAKKEQLGTLVIRRIGHHFAFQRGSNTINHIYSQLKEDHEYSQQSKHRPHLAMELSR